MRVFCLLISLGVIVSSQDVGHQKKVVAATSNSNEGKRVGKKVEPNNLAPEIKSDNEKRRKQPIRKRKSKNIISQNPTEKRIEEKIVGEIDDIMKSEIENEKRRKQPFRKRKGKNIISQNPTGKMIEEKIIGEIDDIMKGEIENAKQPFRKRKGKNIISQNPTEKRIEEKIIGEIDDIMKGEIENAKNKLVGKVKGSSPIPLKRIGKNLQSDVTTTGQTFFRNNRKPNLNKRMGKKFEQKKMLNTGNIMKNTKQIRRKGKKINSSKVSPVKKVGKGVGLKSPGTINRKGENIQLHPNRAKNLRNARNGKKIVLKKPAAITKFRMGNKGKSLKIGKRFAKKLDISVKAPKGKKNKPTDMPKGILNKPKRKGKNIKFRNFGAIRRKGKINQNKPEQRQKLRNVRRGKKLNMKVSERITNNKKTNINNVKAENRQGKQIHSTDMVSNNKKVKSNVVKTGKLTKPKRMGKKRHFKKKTKNIPKKRRRKLIKQCLNLLKNAKPNKKGRNSKNKNKRRNRRNKRSPIWPQNDKFAGHKPKPSYPDLFTTKLMDPNFSTMPIIQPKKENNRNMGKLFKSNEGKLGFATLAESLYKQIDSIKSEEQEIHSKDVMILLGKIRSTIYHETGVNLDRCLIEEDATSCITGRPDIIHEPLMENLSPIDEPSKTIPEPLKETTEADDQPLNDYNEPAPGEIFPLNIPDEIFNFYNEYETMIEPPVNFDISDYYSSSYADYISSTDQSSSDDYNILDDNNNMNDLVDEVKDIVGETLKSHIEDYISLGDKTTENDDISSGDVFQIPSDAELQAELISVNNIVAPADYNNLNAGFTDSINNGPVGDYMNGIVADNYLDTVADYINYLALKDTNILEENYLLSDKSPPADNGSSDRTSNLISMDINKSIADSKIAADDKFLPKDNSPAGKIALTHQAVVSDSIAVADKTDSLSEFINSYDSLLRSPLVPDFETFGDYIYNNDQVTSDKHDTSADSVSSADYNPLADYSPPGDYNPLADYASFIDYISSSVYDSSANYNPSADFVPSAEYNPSADYNPLTDYTPSEDYNPTADYTPSADYNPSADYDSSADYNMNDLVDEVYEIVNEALESYIEDHAPSVDYNPTADIIPSDDYSLLNDNVALTDENIFNNINSVYDLSPAAYYDSAFDYSLGEEYLSDDDYLSMLYSDNAESLASDDLLSQESQSELDYLLSNDNSILVDNSIANIPLSDVLSKGHTSLADSVALTDPALLADSGLTSDYSPFADYSQSDDYNSLAEYSSLAGNLSADYNDLLDGSIYDNSQYGNTISETIKADHIQPAEDVHLIEISPLNGTIPLISTLNAPEMAMETELAPVNQERIQEKSKDSQQEIPIKVPTADFRAQGEVPERSYDLYYDSYQDMAFETVDSLEVLQALNDLEYDDQLMEANEPSFYEDYASDPSVGFKSGGGPIIDNSNLYDEYIMNPANYRNSETVK